jgi:hypothetical protein
MTTDYRALCAELLNRLNGLYEEIIDAGVGCEQIAGAVQWENCHV